MIPPILLTEAISYSLLLVAVFFCTIELKTKHLYHCTYRLFGFSVMLQWCGVLIQGTAWTKYGLTGLGPHATVGALLMSASEITFLLLLLLLAKGYTISRARLSSCSIVKLTMFINTYIVSYIVLFIYQATEFDPGEVLNLYESPAGFGLSLLRCIAWCAFMISTATTIRKYPEKSSFYYPFGLFGSMWLLGGPFLTLVGIGVLDAWVRESVMCGTFAIMAFGGHAAFLVSVHLIDFKLASVSFLPISVADVAVTCQQIISLPRSNQSRGHRFGGRRRSRLSSAYIRTIVHGRSKYNYSAFSTHRRVDQRHLWPVHLRTSRAAQHQPTQSCLISRRLECTTRNSIDRSIEQSVCPRNGERFASIACTESLCHIFAEDAHRRWTTTGIQQ